MTLGFRHQPTWKSIISLYDYESNCCPTFYPNPPLYDEERRKKNVILRCELKVRMVGSLAPGIIALQDQIMQIAKSYRRTRPICLASIRTILDHRAWAELDMLSATAGKLEVLLAPHQR